MGGPVCDTIICNYYVLNAMNGRLGTLIEKAEVFNQLERIDVVLSQLSPISLPVGETS
jgi:hypothetical protein